jgi:hypothetical protein
MNQPSNHPTIQPSNHPTIQPSNQPTNQPTNNTDNGAEPNSINALMFSSRNAPPVVEITSEEYRQKSSGIAAIRHLIDECSNSYPFQTCRMILPEEITLRKTPPIILVNSSSDAEDILKRLARGHEEIGPGPTTMADVVRESERKLRETIQESEKFKGGKSEELRTIIENFLKTEGKSVDCFDQLVRDLKKFRDSLPRFDAIEYLQSNPPSYNDLPELIAIQQLRSTVNFAEYIIEQNFSLIGSEIPKEDDSISRKEDLEVLYAQRRNDILNKYRSGVIIPIDVEKEYTSIALEVLEESKTGYYPDWVKKALMGLVETPSVSSARELSYLVGRACENCQSPREHLERIANGDGPALLKDLLRERWANGICGRLADVAFKLQVALEV